MAPKIYTGRRPRWSRERAEGRDCEDFDRRGDQNAIQYVLPVHAQRLCGIGQSERRVDIEEAVFREARSHRQQDVLRMHADRIDDRHFHFLLRFLDLLELGRFRNREPNPQTDDHENNAGQEWETPTPGVELGISRERGHDREHQRAQH